MVKKINKDMDGHDEESLTIYKHSNSMGGEQEWLDSIFIEKHNLADNFGRKHPLFQSNGFIYDTD